MKTILAYGDSLTYGANPQPGGPRHAYEDHDEFRRVPRLISARLRQGRRQDGCQDAAQ